MLPVKASWSSDELELRETALAVMERAFKAAVSRKLRAADHIGKELLKEQRFSISFHLFSFILYRRSNIKDLKR